MSIVKEFQEFAVKGNVIDLAVGVIIGGAFGKIVSSLVGDILMPPIGKLLGNLNFRDLFFSLDPEKTAGITSLSKAQETGAANISYGNFIKTAIDFVILSFCIFMMVKAINSIKRKEQAAPASTKSCPQCCNSIPLAAKKCGYCTSVLS